MNIGPVIRRLRKEKGMTLEVLADKTHTDAGNLSRLEREKQKPSYETLLDLSSALGDLCRS